MRRMAPPAVSRRDYLAVAHLDEPRAGDAGERRVALAVGLDEELHAVAVLEREVRARRDRVGDLPVRRRLGVGRRRRQDRRRAEEDERVADEVPARVLHRDRDRDRIRARPHRVRAERDGVHDQPLALRDVGDVDRLAAARQVDDPAAAAAEASCDDGGLHRDRAATCRGCSCAVTLTRIVLPTSAWVSLYVLVGRLGDVLAGVAVLVAPQPLVRVGDRLVADPRAVAGGRAWCRRWRCPRSSAASCSRARRCRS